MDLRFFPGVLVFQVREKTQASFCLTALAVFFILLLEIETSVRIFRFGEPNFTILPFKH